MAISPILMSNDKIIKKVNQEISSMSAANGFHFMWWHYWCQFNIKDSLILTKDCTKVLASIFLKYSKSFQEIIDFTVNSKNLIDWQTNKRKPLDINLGIEVY